MSDRRLYAACIASQTLHLARRDDCVALAVPPAGVVFRRAERDFRTSCSEVVHCASKVDGDNAQELTHYEDALDGQDGHDADAGRARARKADREARDDGEKRYVAVESQYASLNP